MEATTVYWGYIGRMEHDMETTICAVCPFVHKGSLASRNPKLPKARRR